MWWIVLLTIFVIVLIIKNHSWSNILTKHKHKKIVERCMDAIANIMDMIGLETSGMMHITVNAK